MEGKAVCVCVWIHAEVLFNLTFTCSSSMITKQTVSMVNIGTRWCLNINGCVVASLSVGWCVRLFPTFPHKPFHPAVAGYLEWKQISAQPLDRSWGCRTGNVKKILRDFRVKCPTNIKKRPEVWKLDLACIKY